MTIRLKYLALLSGTAFSLSLTAGENTALEGKEIYRLIRQQQEMLRRQQTQMQALRKQLKAQQEQIEALHKLVREQRRETENKQRRTAKKVKSLAATSNKVKIGKKGLRIESRDGDYTFQAGGRIHADYAYYDDDRTSMGNGASLRRARIHFKGKFLRDWRYKAEIDFAEDSNVGPRAVWLAYKGWQPVTLRIGNFQEPFSLEEMGGSNAITFMERSLGNSFAPSYHLGIGLDTQGDFWSFSSGLFGETVGRKDDTVDDGWGIAARATLAPILSDRRLLHLGFSSEYRHTDDDDRIRLRARPESNVTNRRLVDTRTINGVKKTVLLGAEFAALYGPLSVQGEYFHDFVVRDRAPNLGFDAAYVQGSWFLTGESRAYRPKRGVFGLIKPLHDYGAWEVALRYSWINLNDRDIQGGEQTNYTLGLNWYVNYNVRFMMNYIFAKAHPNRNSVRENVNIFQMRGQVVF